MAMANDKPGLLRRGFFAALLGAGTGGAARPRLPADPFQGGEWKIQPWDWPCDCGMAGCHDLDAVAEFEVIDRVTNNDRLVCRRCMEEFRRNPVRLLNKDRWRVWLATQ